MAHQRKRYLQSNITKCMSFSPIVGVLGHRQVGKTTLLEQMAKSYFVLDKKTDADEAANDPEGYIKKRAGSWVAFDECQTVPSLFPELKDWVRLHKKPGQFLLSGSIRFSSREAIRESLTGRIVYQELLPFTVSELLELPLSHFCPDVLGANRLEGWMSGKIKPANQLKRINEQIQKYFKFGGLPGICFVRDEQIRNQKINEYLNTMLDRDVRLVKKIQLSLTDIKSIVSSLANHQGQPIDYTRIKKDTNVSTPTIKKVIYALEAIFIIRIIPIQGSTKGYTCYFEDMAEHRSLVDVSPSKMEELIHFCYTQIRAQFSYVLGEETKVFQYFTRGGAMMPFVFSNKNGILGILPIESVDHLPEVSGSIASFLKTYSRSKVLVIHPEIKPGVEVINDRVLLASIGQVI